MTSRGKGALVGLIGIVVLSPDSLLLRLVDCGDAAVVFIRAAFLALVASTACALLPALRRGFQRRPILLYAVFSAFGLASFPLSIAHTHVANVLVIIAATPIIAAVGARWILREKTATATWLAAGVIFFGVIVIFADGLDGDGLVGDLLALFAAVTLAANSIIVRKNPTVSFFPGLAVGGFFVAVASVVFVEWDGVGVRDVFILAVNGGVISVLAFFLIIVASRLLPPAEVGLLFLLETVLAPFWVWLVLAETPPPATFFAGALILTALAGHAIWTRYGGK